MKTNKIVKLLTLGLFILIASACEDDTVNTEGIPHINTNIVELTGTVTTNANVIAFGQTIDLQVTLPQTFESKANVEVRVLLDNGTSSTSSIIVDKGSMTGNGSITLPEAVLDNSGNIDGFNNYCRLEITAILLDENKTGNTYTISSEPIILTVYDFVQFPYDDGVVNKRMTVLLDWNNYNENDLDLYITDSSLGTTFESSETGTRYETDIFNDEHPDGDYIIVVGFYTVTDNNIPWRLFFVHPNQTDIETFTGVFENPSEGNFVFPVVSFTKTTDNSGEISYEFSTP